MNYQQRRQNVLNQLKMGSMAIFYSGNAPIKTADQKYPFVVNKNFYYLTGINQEGVTLLLIKGVKEECLIFSAKYDELVAKWDGASLSFESVSQIADIKLECVKASEDFMPSLGAFLSNSRSAIWGVIETVYFDFGRLNVKTLPTYEEHLSHQIQKLYPYLQLENSHIILSRLRMIKDEHEISLIKEAIKVSTLAINEIYKNAKNYQNETQINALYNYVLNNNQTSASFNSIVASGKNAAILHYGDNNQAIVKDGLILLDLGVEYQQYASDISRTIPASGKFSPRQKEIYQSVLNVNKKVISAIKPGMTIQEFNQLGKDLLAKEAIKLGIINSEEAISEVYYHSLGHFLGLDVHDEADYSIAFAPGMVITVEPGLYVVKENIGIRIEDDILITKDGCINLSSEIAKEIVEIEKLMK